MGCSVRGVGDAGNSPFGLIRIKHSANIYLGRANQVSAESGAGLVQNDVPQPVNSLQAHKNHTTKKNPCDLLNSVVFNTYRLYQWWPGWNRTTDTRILNPI